MYYEYDITKNNNSITLKNTRFTTLKLLSQALILFIAIIFGAFFGITVSKFALSFAQEGIHYNCFDFCCVTILAFFMPFFYLGKKILFEIDFDKKEILYNKYFFNQQTSSKRYYLGDIDSIKKVSKFGKGLLRFFDKSNKLKFMVGFKDIKQLEELLEEITTKTDLKTSS